MSLKLVIENLKHVSDDVWETELCAEELGVLPNPDFCEGEINVLAIKNPAVDRDGRVELALDQARILNLGESERTLVIALRSPAAASARPRAEDAITPLPSDAPLPGRAGQALGMVGAEDNDNAGPEAEAATEVAEAPAPAAEAQASRSRPLPTGFWEVRETRERREW